MGARFDWNGDAFIAQLEQDAREAVNETVDDARDDARATHTWHNDPRPRRLHKGARLVNPSLELQIKSEHADPQDPNPTGRFGYTKRRGFYGLFHEEGTVHEHEYPTLRPTADRVFPTLAEKIRARRR